MYLIGRLNRQIQALDTRIAINTAYLLWAKPGREIVNEIRAENAALLLEIERLDGFRDLIESHNFATEV